MPTGHKMALTLEILKKKYLVKIQCNTDSSMSLKRLWPHCTFSTSSSAICTVVELVVLVFATYIAIQGQQYNLDNLNLIKWIIKYVPK